MKTFCLICVILFSLTAFACDNGQYPAKIVRTYTSFAGEERFIFFLGDELTGTVIYNITGANSLNNQIITYEFCMSLTKYTIVLEDIYGDYWGTSSNPSYVSVYIANLLLFSGTIKTKEPTYQVHTIVPTLTIPINSVWKYTDNPISDNSWKYSSYDDSQWLTATSGSFPVHTAGTRYYRFSIPVASPETTITFILSLLTANGAVAYIQGNEIFRYKMPSGLITPTTSAISDPDLIPISHLFSVPKYYLPASAGSIQIAIEVHLASDTMDGYDSFVLAGEIYTGNAGEMSHSMFTDGNANAEPAASSSTYDVSKAFDNNLSSYYATSTNSSATITYVLNGNSVWINRYAIGTPSTSYGTPTHWKLYASNNEDSWIYLDERIDVSMNAASTLYYFDILSNKMNYNRFKLEIFNSTKTSVSIGELQGFAVNANEPSSSELYAQSSYSFYANVDEVELVPIVSGLTNYRSSTPLPTGLTLLVNGYIRGLPTQTGAFSFTILAYNPIIDSDQSFIITFNILGCNYPSNINIQINKINSRYSKEDSFIITNSNNQVVFESSLFADKFNFVQSFCLPVGAYNFTLLDTIEDGWSSENPMTISIFDTYTSSYRVVSYMHLSYIHSSTILLNLDYAIFPNSNTWKYYQAGIPVNWYKDTLPSQFVDYPAIAPTSQSYTWLFRNTFNYVQHSKYYGMSINILCAGGYVIYINGNEVFRHGLPAGEITYFTIPTEHEITPVWSDITLPLNNVNVGVNTIAVGIANSNIDIQTNVVFQLSLSYVFENSNANRNTLSVQSIPTSSCLDSLIDNASGTYCVMTSTTGEPYIIDFDFGVRHYEYINSYCITSDRNYASRDPSDWSVYGYNDVNSLTFISNVTNAYFSDRKVNRCFYMVHTNAYRYYRLLLIENAGGYSLPLEFSFTIMRFEYSAASSAILPEFTLEPAALTGYLYNSFSSFTSSSDLYFDYRISPSLPSPLEIDTSTGNILGIIPSTFSGSYVITARDPSGKDHTFSVVLTVTTCPLNKILFHVNMYTEMNAYQQSVFVYKFNEKDPFFKKSGFSNNRVTTIAFCEDEGLYKFYIEDSSSNGWDDGYMTVTDIDDKVLLRASLYYTERSRSMFLALGYVIDPHYDNWKLLNSMNAPSSDWNSLLFNDNIWTTVTPYTLPVPVSTTQYFRYVFELNDFQHYASFTTHVYTTHGVVVYINGAEVYRSNLPTGVINHNTYAVSEASDHKDNSFVLSTSFSTLVQGQNIIAIEIHRPQVASKPTIDFDCSVSVVVNNGYRVVDGVPSLEGSTSEDVMKMFDNTAQSVFAVGPECVGVAPRYTFNAGRQEYINMYNIITGPRCNARHPSSWLLEGSNDEGKTWSTLHAVYDKIFTSYKQNITYTFYTEKSYNSFRINALACENTRIYAATSANEKDCEYEMGKFGFQLAELGLFSTRVTASCPPLNGYGGAIEGEIAYKDCDQYYVGRYSSLCTESVYMNETMDCVPGPVFAIHYDSESLIAYKDYEVSFIPVVEGVGYVCEIDNQLPSGLLFNNNTGIISGISHEIFASSHYTISCYTKRYTTPATVTISISSQEKYILPIWLWIVIVVLALLLIAVIVIAIVCRSKSRKSNAKKINKPTGTVPISSSNKAIHI